ncbi:hypothetical protein PAMP_020729 [Pampus punctatissimus]
MHSDEDSSYHPPTSRAALNNNNNNNNTMSKADTSPIRYETVTSVRSVHLAPSHTYNCTHTNMIVMLPDVNAAKIDICRQNASVTPTGRCPTVMSLMTLRQADKVKRTKREVVLSDAGRR